MTYDLPANYDPDDNRSVDIPKALIPLVAGRLHELEDPSAWAAADQTAGAQAALLVQERLLMPGSQNANTVYAGPTAGLAATPTFRSLGAADLPADAALQSQANVFTADQTVNGIPLIQSLINGGSATVGDHFDTFSPAWNWSTSGLFSGAPAQANLSIYPSHLVFVNDTLYEHHFMYQTSAGSTDRVIQARVFKGMQSPIGLRLATDSELEYIEVRLEDSATNGLLKLVAYQNGYIGNTIVDNLTPAYYTLTLGATSTWGFWYFAFTTNTPGQVIAGSGGWAGWITIQRWGITFQQMGYANDPQRACGVDWFTVIG
jgi:hypothetical protein